MSTSLSVQDLPEPVSIQSSVHYTQCLWACRIWTSHLVKSLLIGRINCCRSLLNPSFRWTVVRQILSTESDKPFRLPYRRVPPCHYDKLRTPLHEMEELGIIRKSQSEYASPLVLVVKPNGVMKLLRHWPKLSIKDGILYKVKNVRQMNMTTFQVWLQTP